MALLASLVSGPSKQPAIRDAAEALNGLYLMIGEQESKIRQDQACAGSAILRKVFGSLK